MSSAAPRHDSTRERLPELLTPPFLCTIGLLALVALASELVLLPRLVGLDGALWRAILYWRSCRTDRMVDHVVHATTLGAAALLAAAALLRVRRDGVRAVWPPLVLCLLGLHVGKLLKNVFQRERPSMLPGAIPGHSFPSGHVMNTTLAAIAVMILAATFRHPRRWGGLAVLAMATIFLGRLVLAHHWFLDAVGGVLAALALTGLALPAVRRRPLVVPAALALAITLVLAFVTHARGRHIVLPSPLSASADGVEVHPHGLLGSDALQGSWEPTAGHFRRGGYLWLHGSGTVTLTLDTPPAEGDGVHPVPAGSEATLAIGGRPDLVERRCLTFRVQVNGRDLRPFVPFVGWREYRLLLPPGTLRPGRNDVRLEVRDVRGEPWRFAVAYVRLDRN
ncbi:MAG TPA: phosphatase PAP2 family protein [Candidatus Binatia bacterium]